MKFKITYHALILGFMMLLVTQALPVHADYAVDFNLGEQYSGYTFEGIRATGGGTSVIVSGRVQNPLNVTVPVAPDVIQFRDRNSRWRSYVKTYSKKVMGVDRIRLNSDDLRTNRSKLQEFLKRTRERREWQSKKPLTPSESPADSRRKWYFQLPVKGSGSYTIKLLEFTKTGKIHVGVLRSTRKDPHVFTLPPTTEGIILSVYRDDDWVGYAALPESHDLITNSAGNPHHLELKSDLGSEMQLHRNLRELYEQQSRHLAMEGNAPFALNDFLKNRVKFRESDQPPYVFDFSEITSYDRYILRSISRDKNGDTYISGVRIVAAENALHRLNFGLKSPVLGFEVYTPYGRLLGQFTLNEGFNRKRHIIKPTADSITFHGADPSKSIRIFPGKSKNSLVTLERLSYRPNDDARAAFQFNFVFRNLPDRSRYVVKGFSELNQDSKSMKVVQKDQPFNVSFPVLPRRVEVFGRDQQLLAAFEIKHDLLPGQVTVVGPHGARELKFFMSGM